MGDVVKKNITAEKWAIEARTHCTVQCEPEVFERLVVKNALSVVPADYDDSTPVVVATVTGSDSMGEIFGASKIKGGTRMGSLELGCG